MARQLAVARGGKHGGLHTVVASRATWESSTPRHPAYHKKTKTTDKNVSRSWRSEARFEVRALARTRGDTTIGEPSEPSTQLSPQPSFKVSKARKQGWRDSLLWRVGGNHRGLAHGGCITRDMGVIDSAPPATPQKQKRPTKMSVVLGGLKRIRTAVAAFAELCLATRPSDHITLSGVQIYKLFLFSQNFCHFSTEKSKFSTKTASEEPNSAKKS